MPVLLTEDILKSKKYTSIGRKDKNWEQPLDIGWKMSAQSRAFIEGEDAIDPTKVEMKEKEEFKSKEWKYLYKNHSDKILLPAAVNNHYEYFKLYVDWGSDINIQDFQGWTPLHWAAYSGNIDILKFLTDKKETEVEIEDDERRTGLLVAIETGNVLGNENPTSILLEAGSQLDRDLWDKLLILSADHDLIVYPRIAMKQNILSLKYKNDEKFSLHRIIKWESINLLRYILQSCDPKVLKKAALKKDRNSKTWFMLAENAQNEEIKKELEEKITDDIVVDDVSDSDTVWEDEIIQSINEEVLIKETDLKESSKAPFSRDEEKEYMLKIKKDFDDQYKSKYEQKIDKKDEEINRLKRLVLKQDKVIKEMKSSSRQSSEENYKNSK